MLGLVYDNQVLPISRNVPIIGFVESGKKYYLIAPITIPRDLVKPKNYTQVNHYTYEESKKIEGLKYELHGLM